MNNSVRFVAWVMSFLYNKKRFWIIDRFHKERQKGHDDWANKKGESMDLTNFGDIIGLAISREEAAIKAYGDMSEKAQSPGLRELLRELQDEEKNHKRLLENISETQIQDFEIKEVPDLKISDYLTEEKTKEEMTFQNLLVLAAKKEQEAVDLYSNLEQNADEAELKKLFQFLIQQEKNHKLKLETEYEKHVLTSD